MKLHIWSAIFFVDTGIFFIFGIPFYRQVEFGTPDFPFKLLVLTFQPPTSFGAAYQIVAPKVFGSPRQAKVPEISSKVTDQLSESRHSVCQNQKKYKNSAKDESPSSAPGTTRDASPSSDPGITSDSHPSSAPGITSD